ncbi:MAG TPA: cell division protein FtsZ, partial [Acidobacteriota bacterium]|nr:cell division protein FtsZ [Acidobacteriota bacterium]
GETRALEATQRAIASPLLEEASIEGARGVLVNITGGKDLTLFEVNEASSIIREAAHEDANIIFGAVLDERMQDEMKITVIATGFEQAAAALQQDPLAGLNRNVAGLRTGGLGSSMPRSGEGGGISRDDLDIPAFMRKKAD